MSEDEKLPIPNGEDCDPCIYYDDGCLKGKDSPVNCCRSNLSEAEK